MNDNTVIAYELPEGTLWMEVMPACRDTFYSPSTHEWGARYEPRVRVSSFPGDTYKDPTYLSMRGHRYTVDKVFAIRYIHGLMEDGRCYSRGFQQESGNQVDVKSPVRPRLRELVSGVLARFESDHPDWRAMSRLLLARQEVDQARTKAVELRRDLEAAEAVVGERAAELARVAAEHPCRTFDTRQERYHLTVVK